MNILGFSQDHIKQKLSSSSFDKTLSQKPEFLSREQEDLRGTNVRLPNTSRGDRQFKSIVG